MWSVVVWSVVTGKGIVVGIGCGYVECSGVECSDVECSDVERSVVMWSGV
jgi:hypothetical protein